MTISTYRTNFTVYELRHFRASCCHHETMGETEDSVNSDNCRKLEIKQLC